MDIEYGWIRRDRVQGANKFEVRIHWKHSVFVLRPVNGQCHLIIDGQVIEDGPITLLSPGGVRIQFEIRTFAGRSLFGELPARVITEKPLVLQKAFLGGGNRILT